ncbi:MAG TPA: S8 family serine peptidase, partial [Verrucomicrobiae bacterium]|nr:S8 family serine peptidase [Verrucomicrobiae bacterium]
PGQDIFSCGNGNDGDYRNLSGTSMAAPHVVGVCALTWARYSGETYRQIINRVLNGVDPLPALAGKTVTGGRLNLQKALGTTPSALPVVTVVVSDSSAAEAGSDSGTFVVTRTGGTTSALTVNYSMGGNAANGTDYNPLQTSVTIPAGAASATVTVTPADDSAVEGAETAILTILAHAAYAVGSPNSATITLSDNDALVAFPFGVSPASGLASKGARGGSFTPDSQIYVLTNSSDVPLGWAVTKDRTWVSLSATNGTLAPFSGATVTASINAQANQLAPGTYNAHIRFLNTSTSVGDTTRKATLKIHRPSTLSSVVYNVVNGPLLGLEEFRFRVFGDPGQIHIIQASTNLVDWATLLTNTMPPVGYFDFKDNQVGRVQRCFYRTISKAGDPVVLGDGVFRGDRILVKPLPGVDLSLLYRLLGLQVLQSFPAIGNLQIIQLPGGGIVENILAVLRQSGLVEYAEPDFQVQALVEPNDFRFVDGSLWNLRNVGQNGGQADADIDAPEGWEAQNAADNIIVAVIDTGVRYTHEDLAANIWVNSAETAGNNLDDDGNGYVDDVHGIDAINNSGDPNDVHGHGTHVSGVVGAVGNNTVGVVGVAWRVKIIGCRFLDPTGNGFIADAIKCIDYSRSKGAKIINTSWGSTTFNSAALRDAFDSARQAGIIVTAAAGNAADNNDVNPLYPASYDLDNIVSVAATTRNDELASFSSYGATSVDLAAPGAAIFSCWNGSDSDYRYFDGTSMSAPHVTGVSALLWAHYPAENYQQIINRVLSNVDPLPSLAGKCVSGGRLNLQRALGI